MKTLDEIRGITNSHEALVAMEDVAFHYNIAFDDALGDWANRSGKHVIDCDNQDAIDNNAPLVFGWDNDNEAACHAMDLIRYINDNRDSKETTFIYTHDGDLWQWWALGEEYVYYHTDEHGDGVFIVDKQGIRQLAGTFDFSVCGLSEKYAKQKIREFMMLYCSWYF